MNELSLFTGAGGGLLGTKLLGWTPIGYVENNEYCQRVIAQRIKDGFLEEAPIFGDIRAFNREGYADAYQGMADVITAGFPCQPWSTAARGRQRSDRDMWPETFETVRHVKPNTVFLENVSRNAIRRARHDLEAAGYSCCSATVSSAAVGAADNRKREWLFAYADSDSKPSCAEYEEVEVLRRLPGLDTWQRQPPRDMGMDACLAHWMDRARAIGGGQNAAVVATVWRLLTDDHQSRDIKSD